ncbi:hypothetical protein CLAIMM_13066 isoform 2 [Cladophialophora immunda]|nr:hypothetical protein CLAIMM_13066 isoform 2 [Cladophialophora immunda]
MSCVTEARRRRKKKRARICIYHAHRHHACILVAAVAANGTRLLRSCSSTTKADAYPAPQAKISENSLTRRIVIMIKGHFNESAGIAHIWEFLSRRLEVWEMPAVRAQYATDTTNLTQIQGRDDSPGLLPSDMIRIPASSAPVSLPHDLDIVLPSPCLRHMILMTSVPPEESISRTRCHGRSDLAHSSHMPRDP